MTTYPQVHTFSGRFMVLPQDHVHAYVVELENATVVVDTTLALDSATELRELAESLGKPIEAVLLTHGHPDHYTGLAKFTDIPRYSSQGTLDFAHEEDRVKSPVAKGYLGDAYPETRVFPDQIIEDGFRLPVGGVDFVFTDLGPAESDSDGMWTFEKDGVVHAFVGDLVADRCHCFFRDGHAEEWLDVLDRLDRDLPDSAKLYIGHGPTPASKQAIAWQRGYIEKFLESVDAISAKVVPVSRETQEEVIAAMREYLDSDATLFLLDYELDISIPAYWAKRGFAVTSALTQPQLT
jgi:glyoxylase-like metal-dependent hydrolase (beta-lactamase superfamily II)